MSVDPAAVPVLAPPVRMSIGQCDGRLARPLAVQPRGRATLGISSAMGHRSPVERGLA